MVDPTAKAKVTVDTIIRIVTLSSRTTAISADGPDRSNTTDMADGIMNANVPVNGAMMKAVTTRANFGAAAARLSVIGRDQP